jgi:predicted aspartyl protease
MEKVGSLFYIKVYFWNLQTLKYEYCWLALDTGASAICISKDIIETLGYNVSNSPSEKIMTASRFENINKIMIEKMKIGDFELENIEINVMDFPENNFLIGVIGLNVLTKFDINILFSKKTLEFTLIEEG